MEHTIVISDPAVMMGKPVIAGTRITVERILERLAAGESEWGLPHRRGHMVTLRRDFGHGDSVHGRERVCPATRVSGPLLKAKASVASLRSLGQVQPPV